MASGLAPSAITRCCSSTRTAFTEEVPMSIPRKLGMAGPISDRPTRLVEEIDMARAEPDWETVTSADLGSSIRDDSHDSAVRGRGVHLCRAAEIFRNVSAE